MFNLRICSSSSDMCHHFSWRRWKTTMTQNATHLCWGIWSQKNNGGQCLMSFFFYLDGTKGSGPHWTPLDYINTGQRGDEQCENSYLFRKSTEWKTRKCLEMETYFSSLAPLLTWSWLKKRNIEILRTSVYVQVKSLRFKMAKCFKIQRTEEDLGHMLALSFGPECWGSTAAVPLANTRGSMFPL